jgi:AAA15 family ATPase/GTPase
MLVQFMVKNVLSFREETVLDMTAINAYKEHESNLINMDLKERFLRVAAIYGANASGKSNLYTAMLYFQKIILQSLNNVAEDSVNAIEKYYQPFLFEEQKSNSEFQIIEIVGGYEYKYGFEYNEECVVTEWLYRKNLKNNRTVTVFERAYDKVEFGASVRKHCDLYQDQIPTETLVLSFLKKLKLKTTIFSDVYDAIMDIFVVPIDFCEDFRLLEALLPSVINRKKEDLVRFLSAIDTGIKDIGYNDSEKDIYFYTIHKGKDGKNYPLNLLFESEGTIKSIMLFIYVQNALQNNKALFVDELNIKLHPLLLKFIIDLFYNEKSKAQLIYTTHDTTLMDKRFFRRDQIWFVQKDEYGYSELSALSDFKVRSDASFEKDYLAGVYGGIPKLANLELKEGE